MSTEEYDRFWYLIDSNWTQYEIDNALDDAYWGPGESVWD